MTEEGVSNGFQADTIAIVGVGLLGGSIAAAVKQRRLARRVLGIGRSPDRLVRAQQAGLIDDFATNTADAGKNAQFVIVCTPVDRIAEDVQRAAANCQAGTLITDVGSVKGAVCRDIEQSLPPEVTFIGSHPLAGSEKTGAEFARSDLFEGRLCVVTPRPETPPQQHDRLIAFWRSLGMSVVELSPEDHDQALAQTSHVPHVVAAALARLVSEPNRQFTSSGFADATRIAASDPDVWTPILTHNVSAIVEQLDEFSAQLAQFRQAIAERNEQALKTLWNQAKRNREASATGLRISENG